MKKINIILIILLACFGVHTQTEQQNFYIKKSSTNFQVQNTLELIKKYAIPIAVTPILFYYQQDIINSITYRPYLSSLCFYVLINYFCDSILHYQEQKALCHLISLLKKICFYLVLTHGIKNEIEQKHLLIDQDFTEEDFLQSITENLPYSFEQTTLISLKLYQELKICLQSYNESISIESEEFVFLCHARSINIEIMLYLTQNDPTLYQAITQFQATPKTHTQPLLEHLKFAITESFSELQENLLQSNIRSSAQL
ncbi:hypothetical protein KBC04_00765 [Candidatus Babeliales bacterium]|nr:hypothetical protein [Candidatus Babeliales bacterium]MBP9843377.1 hypothetical protein [Candidatus Babeliales bacterium]